MKKPLVVQSINDASGDRCVDILDTGHGFSFVECRRDAEDNHGWRPLAPARGLFASAVEARLKATEAVAWMEHV
ncbi:MAG: hypothetical protein QNL16_05425 [Rhodobacterales bacterium]|jgi:hypothetical protein|nr:hypothetical protein [Rhodobacter sp.]